MKLPCLTFLLLAAYGAAAQKMEKFYDFNWKETDVSHARFYSIIENTDSGWHRRDYYLHGPTLQMEGWYMDSACKILAGDFMYVYPNKKLESRGRYLLGKKQGLWITWHPNGMMADSTVYDNGHPTGTRLGWYSNGYPSDSSVYDPDGSGVEVRWFDNGNPSSAGRLAAGFKRHGRWQFFHKNGRISAIELYDHGQLVNKQYFSEDGQPVTDTTDRSTSATFNGGNTAWLKYLGKHLYFPDDYKITNSDEAAVVITMTVDEDGKVVDAYVSTPFYPAFDNIALAAVRHSPPWQPAKDHNRRVSAVFRQPVIFQQQPE